MLYVVAMGFVALHLYHGAWSMFQSLGLDNPDRNRGLRLLALGLALGLFLGFTAVPMSFAVGALEAKAEAARAAVAAPAEASVEATAPAGLAAPGGGAP